MLSTLDWLRRFTTEYAVHMYFHTTQEKIVPYKMWQNVYSIDAVHWLLKIKSNITYVQRTHNTAIRIITNTRRYEHITSVLRQLHWLPIQERIEFKVLCLTYKALHNMVPLYLTQFLSQKIVLRHLRCKDQHMLQVPLTSPKCAGDRSFQKAAPMLYNALLVTIKTAPSLAVFKKRLKTYLFTKAYMV